MTTTNNNFRIKNAVQYSDSTVQTTAWTGTVAYSNVSGTPTLPNQSLDTTSSPTFANLTVNGTMTTLNVTTENVTTENIVTQNFADGTSQTTAWTGTVASSQITSVSTSKVNGLSVVGYTNNYTDLTGKPNQSLDTTSNVQFVNVVATGGLKATTGTQAAQTISAGGYPLDSNGQALITQSNTQSAALVVSNYTANIRPTAIVRAYGQNTPNGGATTAGTSALILEGSRGTGASPTATGSGDTIGAINFGGYDGASWLSSQGTGGTSALSPATIIVQASEAFANNGSTTTNAGTAFFIRNQPVGTQLNSTSRRNWFVTSWTAGSTATNSPPVLGVGIGQGSDGTTPTLVPSGGVGSFGTGSGRTNWAWNGVQQFIQGVPSQDTAPDNATLTATNLLTFIGHRRSNVSGRRDALQSGDTVGGLIFQAQTTNSSSGNGSAVGSISFNMEETSGASARGTRYVVQTTNTGTTTLATRQLLTDRNSIYRSDTHSFYEKNGSFKILDLNTSSSVLSANTIVLCNNPGVNYLQLDSNGATFGTGSATAIIAAKTTGNDLQLLSGGGSVNGGLVQLVSGGGVNISGGAGTSIANLSTSSATFNVPVQFPVYTVATKPASGSVGQQICISDSAGGGNPNGMMAFWDTTNARWSYVHDNGAV